MFHRALEECERAKGFIRENDMPGKGKAIDLAMRIVCELEASLDHDKAPDLASNLAKLYGFVQTSLQRASLELKEQPIDQAVKVLLLLRGAFAEAATKADAP